MPKYFKVGRLLVDIDLAQVQQNLCFIDCGTRLTYPYCPLGGYNTRILCYKGNTYHCGLIGTDCAGFTQNCLIMDSVIDPCRMLGSGCAPLLSPYEGMIDLTDPIQIDELKGSLQQEIDRLDRMGKVLANEMQPQTLKDVAAVEKQLEISQQQLDEAKAEIKKVRTKLAGAKKPK